MKVRIEGVENPYQKEKLREYVAKAVAEVWKVCRADSKIREIIIDCNPGSSNAKESNGKEKLATFDHLLRMPNENASILVLPSKQQELIDSQLKRWDLIPLVQGKWGVYKIDPFPRVSLNFVGPPGTGKTLTAHNFASRLNKKIIEVSYADIVSKYFGEAAKNLSALFEFAKANDAVLFIDEAETLLSKRNTAASEGADHAVNSMRSQLLLLIQNTPIISIFASNLVEGYDPAFLSRLTRIDFPLPDENLSERIWETHLIHELPLDSSITANYLAREFKGLTGRQIRQIVIEAAYRAASREHANQTLRSDDFSWAHDLVCSEIATTGEPNLSGFVTGEPTGSQLTQNLISGV
ncbi:MAG: ATP-binding protein [Stigonema ocellatum SAG 48.90 = DSM 106950]|nr:ATP-binding protein [Stigonema ocellatum SAG 48.90 = DSM 106950]